MTTNITMQCLTYTNYRKINISQMLKRKEKTKSKKVQLLFFLKKEGVSYYTLGDQNQLNAI